MAGGAVGAVGAGEPARHRFRVVADAGLDQHAAAGPPRRRV